MRGTYQRTGYGGLPNVIDGKKVFRWKRTYKADDWEGDEFKPIFDKRYTTKRFLMWKIPVRRRR